MDYYLTIKIKNYEKKLLKNLTVAVTLLAGIFSFAQTVTIVSPANGAVNVDPASDIVFTIAGNYEVADAGTNRGILIRTAPNVTTGQIKIDTDNEVDPDGTVSTVYDGVGVTTVTINPTADFPSGSTVALQLNNNCFKVVGSGSPGTLDNDSVNDDVWNFTTATPTLPFGSIISLSPANGATDVDLTGSPSLVMVVKGEIGQGNDNNGDVFVRPVQGSSTPQTRIDADGTDSDGTVTFSYNAGADETTVNIAPTTYDFGVDATGDIAIRILSDANNGITGVGSDAGQTFGADVIAFGDWTFSYDPSTLFNTTERQSFLFDVKDDTEGWEGFFGPIIVNNGVLAFLPNSPGDNSRLELTTYHVNTTTAPTMTIVLKNNSTGDTHLHVRVSDGNTASSIAIPITTSDVSNKTYQLDMTAFPEWTGEISDIRLFPRAGGAGGDRTSATGSIEIDSIVFDNAVLSVDDVDFKDDPAIKLYPNPAKDYITVSTSSQGVLKLKVFNLLGQEVLSNEGTNRLNVSSLLTGAYIVKVYQEQNIVSTKKFFKK